MPQLCYPGKMCTWLLCKTIICYVHPSSIQHFLHSNESSVMELKGFFDVFPNSKVLSRIWVWGLNRIEGFHFSTDPASVSDRWLSIRIIHKYCLSFMPRSFGARGGFWQRRLLSSWESVLQSSANGPFCSFSNRLYGSWFWVKVYFWMLAHSTSCTQNNT